MKKKILFITTSRADYGPCKNLISLMQSSKKIIFNLIVSGTHLSKSFGKTVKEIKKDKIKIYQEIDIFKDTNKKGLDDFDVVQNTFKLFKNIFQKINPDFYIIYGDRYEMLPLTYLAYLNRSKIIHINGGEVTFGAIDESIRHSITKFSSYHFVANEANKKRVIQMGEDPSREGLLETPKRVVKAFKEYFKGYKEDPNQILDKTFGDVEGYDDMVIQKNISVQSHCEHHMAPIIGKAHVAYIPKDRVVGLSKLARVVEVFSKRLQTQERLTMQIANTLMESLDAKGVAVTIDSTHQCMTMRGIKKEQASTVTNYYLGQFKDDLSFQNRYLRFISIAKD